MASPPLLLPARGSPTIGRPEARLLHHASRAELVAPLTDREHEILALLAQRLSNKEIAQALVISPQTVKRHIANLYEKLQAGGRREAVAVAIRLGLLQD